jgi:hypothetical protein
MPHPPVGEVMVALRATGVKKLKASPRGSYGLKTGSTSRAVPTHLE